MPVHPIYEIPDEVYDALKAHIEERWGGATPLTPIKWPNDRTKKPEPPSPYVVFEMSGDLFDQESVGADVQEENRWDEEGGITLYLMVPQGEGFPRGAAKRLASMFRGAALLEGRLEFLHAAIGEPGASEDGAWAYIPVRVDWRLMDA